MIKAIALVLFVGSAVALAAEFLAVPRLEYASSFLYRYEGAHWTVSMRRSDGAVAIHWYDRQDALHSYYVNLLGRYAYFDKPLTKEKRESDRLWALARVLRKIEKD